MVGGREGGKGGDGGWGGGGEEGREREGYVLREREIDERERNT